MDKIIDGRPVWYWLTLIAAGAMMGLAASFGRWLGGLL